MKFYYHNTFDRKCMACLNETKKQNSINECCHHVSSPFVPFTVLTILLWTIFASRKAKQPSFETTYFWQQTLTNVRFGNGFTICLSACELLHQKCKRKQTSSVWNMHFIHCITKWIAYSVTWEAFFCSFSDLTIYEHVKYKRAEFMYAAMCKIPIKLSHC